MNQRQQRKTRKKSSDKLRFRERVAIGDVIFMFLMIEGGGAIFSWGAWRLVHPILGYVIIGVCTLLATYVANKAIRTSEEVILIENHVIKRKSRARGSRWTVTSIIAVGDLAGLRIDTEKVDPTPRYNSIDGMMETGNEPSYTYHLTALLRGGGEKRMLSSVRRGKLEAIRSFIARKVDIDIPADSLELEDLFG